MQSALNFNLSYNTVFKLNFNFIYHDPTDLTGDNYLFTRFSQ